MTHFDSHGLPITTVSFAAAEQFRIGIVLLQSSWPGADVKLDAAIAADPDFALARAARARLHAICAQPAQARAQIAHAERLAIGTTERECSHIAVLSAAVNGHSKQALELALAHLDQWPRDTVIMSLPLGAFGLFAFSGMANHDQARVDLCERHANHFDSDDWWFLANRGWSLVENGDVVRGRAMLERSHSLRPNNAHGAHALAHALYEAGASNEATSFIDEWLPSYDNSGILHGHIAWHGALVALERGDAEGALRTYACHIQPAVSQGMPINVVSDAASLLWRIGSYGHSVPSEFWAQISDYSDRAFPKAGHAFVDTHMMMIAAAVGNEAALEARLSSIEQRVTPGSSSVGAVVPAIGRAFLSFAEGNFERCAAILETCAADVVRIGGSGAQREVVEDTLLVAWMQAGNTEKAKHLLQQRLHRRPSERDTRWINQLHA